MTVPPPPDLHTRADEAAAVIPVGRSARNATLAVVLGSGLNELADRIADATVVPYDRVPHFPRTTVAGHEGKVLLGKLGGVPAVVFQGRFHYYEGHDLETVTFPVRVLQQLGVVEPDPDRRDRGHPAPIYDPATWCS